MKYRDLNPKERHEVGDEMGSTIRNKWSPIHSSFIGTIVGTNALCRRPLPESESPWTPISTPPTEADGDKHGQVLSRGIDGSVTNCYFHHAVWPHWMRIPPLPEQSTKNERLAELIAERLRRPTRDIRTTAEHVLEVLNEENPE